MIINTDGGATNKGDGVCVGAAIGIISSDDNMSIVSGFYLGDGITSNMAEYEAIIAALKLAIHYGFRDVEIHADSQLCVRHILKKCLGKPGYVCSDVKLLPRLNIVNSLINKLEKFNIVHIKRDSNKEADALVWKAREKKNITILPSRWVYSDIENIITNKIGDYR